MKILRKFGKIHAWREKIPSRRTRNRTAGGRLLSGSSGRTEPEKVRSVRRSTVLFRDFSKGLMEEKF